MGKGVGVLGYTGRVWGKGTGRQQNQAACAKANPKAQAGWQNQWYGNVQGMCLLKCQHNQLGNGITYAKGSPGKAQAGNV